MFSWLLTSALAEEAAETAAKEPTWLENAVKKLVETPLTVWIAVLVLVALGVILLVVTKTSKNWNAKMLSFASLSIALSFVLSCIRLYRMPQGGSVTPASMLPLMLFSTAFGVGPGLLAGLVYGILQYLQGGWFLNVWQFALDYLLAFAALGLAGLAKKLPEKWGLYCAMLIAVIGRALSATLAGIMFWDTAPVASLVYNGTYLVPEVVICMILAAIIAKPVMRVMKAGTR
ncbi:MAG: energy-coupled thiamine transporter ThiT [Eubacteriales bacterium]